MVYYEFLRGVRVEVEEDKFVVISKSGQKTFFDDCGNLLNDADYIEEVYDGAYSRHFDFMGVNERNLVKRWHSQQKPGTPKQAFFIDTIGEALRLIGYDYCIANLEPSCDDEDRLYYEEGEVVAKDLSGYQWVEMAKAFAPEHKSGLADIYELFLWYAWRIAKGYWTLEYVCDNSSGMGNYCNSPDSSGSFELSGAREVGGRYDGTGNTYKLVLNGNKFSMCGGYWASAGYCFPVATVFGDFLPYTSLNNTCGVVVLRKV